jgi:hypothetical protein
LRRQNGTDRMGTVHLYLMTWGYGQTLNCKALNAIFGRRQKGFDSFGEERGNACASLKFRGSYTFTDLSSAQNY